MSIDCRYYTNGEKIAYTMLHTDTGIVEEFEKIEDIPIFARHYFERMATPKFCGPDLAQILGLSKVFYPEWPKECGHFDYNGERCIAESCKYAEQAEGWSNCPYFTGQRWGRQDA